MLEFLRDGGYAMWVIVLMAVGIGVLAVRAVLALRRETEAAPTIASTIDAVLFWGAFALVTGVLGTVVGISQMARAVGLAGEVSAGLAWAGMRVALTTTIAGGVVFSLAALAWFALRTALLRRRTRLASP